MEFNFSRHGLSGKEMRKQRLFEIVPGLTSWCIILGMLILAFRAPLVAAIIIIAFDFYWVLRLFYLTSFLVLSYFRLSVENKTDWMEKIGGLSNPEHYIRELLESDLKSGFRKRLSNYLYFKELKIIVKKNIRFPRVEDIYQLVIIPIAKETKDVIEPGIQSIAGNTFSAKKILIVFAVEERAGEEVQQGVRDIQMEYKHLFFDILFSPHKDGVQGESRVKGANATCAAKMAAEYIASKKILFENVIVSCFDCDTVINPQYFACLTYSFMICPDRIRASFQPIPVYHNNIWDVPGFARVFETGSSFFQLIEATNSEKLVTFSSHSMSFKALVDAGYWPVDMISDDSAIYWKAYLKFDGNYRVVPMYTTVSMDIVAADSLWQTVINEYKQKRRWAWGVENFPIVMRGFLKNNKISFYNKIRLGFKLFEGHISWATWAFLLTVIGWLPALFASAKFQHTVLYYSAPRITGTIFNLSTICLVTCILLSLGLLPRKKESHPILKRIVFAIQWLTIPFIAIFLSAIPALDAQTRLMLGKRMEFWVADKK